MDLGNRYDDYFLRWLQQLKLNNNLIDRGFERDDKWFISFYKGRFEILTDKSTILYIWLKQKSAQMNGSRNFVFKNTDPENCDFCIG